MKLLRIVIFLSMGIISFKALAYPDFIGFGYRSCLVCHYSGSGGGALTDYGRGVWATEIASGTGDQEKDAERSHFLSSIESPWWLKPGIKTRNLRNDSAPGSADNQIRYFTMQVDLNLNLFFKKDQSIGLISTLGYAESETKIYPDKFIQGKPYAFWKEYYLRNQWGKEIWSYLGFMDKTFGIRHPDHTSYNRSVIGLGAYDQVMGLLIQWAQKDTDWFLQSWTGNPNLEEADRKSGGSFMFETKILSRHAVGFSLLSESNKAQEVNQLISTHGKFGYGSGNAVLIEVGHRTAGPSSSPQKSGYIYTQADMAIRQGLYLISGGEYYKADVSLASADQMMWKLGFQWMPVQRMEFRVQAVDKKTFNTQPVEKDRWSIQSQLHLSL